MQYESSAGTDFLGSSMTGNPARRRSRIVLTALAALLAVAMIAGASIGTTTIPPGRVAALIAQPAIGRAWVDGPAWQEVVVWKIRLPRVCLAALVGGGLALCGAVLQGVFRNPMADPGVLGVSGGASLGAVTALYLKLPGAVPGAAFVGATAAAFCVYALAARRGKAPITLLLLAGIAVGGLASSLTTFLLALSLEQYEVGQRILFWLMGGLDGKSWAEVRLALPAVGFGGALLLLFARDLNVLTQGEESAAALGVDVARVRRRALVLTSAVTAACVAVGGALTFLGLVAPHMLRLAIGPDHRLLLPGSFLFGGS
ncbi:MAG: FecCD family ABC transporter permease, partial [Planctomycetia bacterium]